MNTAWPQPTTLRIGTRSSRLALCQAEWVADRLRFFHSGLDITLVEIKTHGDRDQRLQLATIGGTGLFTKEIQRAVLDGSVDIAVHSLKDLPTQGPRELVLAAVPEREDVADALIALTHRTLQDLPTGARVGTSSLRRRAQLLYLHPDLNVVTIRGNVETRLNQALESKLDAVVLAWAGLHRLGLERYVTQRLEPPAFLPAVGQGALGIECRRDDTRTRHLLTPLNNPATHRAIVAERTVLAELEGGCIVPIAAWARDNHYTRGMNDAGLLALDAAVFDPDGQARISAAETGPLDAPQDLGVRVAQALRAQGAEPLLQRGRSPTS